jgi:hypothetical protein
MICLLLVVYGSLCEDSNVNQGAKDMDDQEITLLGLSDVDREALEDAFGSKGIANNITFNDSEQPSGSAGALDALTATVILTGMGLVIGAISDYVCRERKHLRIQKKSGEEFTIEVIEEGGCKDRVIAQLTKILSGSSLGSHIDFH